MKKIISHSETETENFAFELAKTLSPGVVLTLEGDLGAGKTVFARGFARGLGVKEAVSSPTYTIAQEYALEGNKRLYHLDLYRISSAEAGLAFGVDEFFNDPKERGNGRRAVPYAAAIKRIKTFLSRTNKD